jgi:Tfp pilus assembly protein PilF
MLLWFCVAASISYLVEVARRFLSDGPDVEGTVIQGLIGLITVSGLVQFARQLVDIKNSEEKARPVLVSRGWLICFALGLAVGAGGLRLLLPRIAQLYSDRGTDRWTEYVGHVQGSKAAPVQLSLIIDDFERAIRLDSGYTPAHFNLADVYEYVQDLDKAELGYRAAIVNGDPTGRPYLKLARMGLLRRKDHATALKLLDSAERLLDLVPNGDLEPIDRERIRYMVWRDRAWAHLLAKNFSEGTRYLRQAHELQTDGRSIHAIWALILDAQKQPAAAIHQWRQFLEAPAVGWEPVEPSWTASAKERIATPLDGATPGKTSH